MKEQGLKYFQSFEAFLIKLKIGKRESFSPRIQKVQAIAFSMFLILGTNLCQDLVLVGFNPRNNTYITLVIGPFSFFYFLTHSIHSKITKMMKHQQMIKASDDASSIQNSNTVRHKGKASSGRKVIWYFPRSLLEFIYRICGGFFSSF